MSSYTEGQTHQLMNALEAEGFTPDHVTKLGQFGNLAGIKSVLEGLAKIKPVAEDASRVITLNSTTIAVNLAATPILPFTGAEVGFHFGESWAIVEKRADGLYVNGHKVVMHLSKRQMGGKSLKGYELRKELTGLPVLNANILDALIDNPHLIPEEWKKYENGNTRYIYFWGTNYHDSGGNLCVRYLCFGDGMWGGVGSARKLVSPRNLAPWSLPARRSFSGGGVGSSAVRMCEILTPLCTAHFNFRDILNMKVGEYAGDYGLE